MYSSFLIILISLFSGILTELLSWFFVYRTAEFERLKKSIEATQAKLEKRKEDQQMQNSNQPANKAREKKISHLDSQLSVLNRELSMKKFRSTFISGFALVAVFAVLSSLFEQKIVAKLPFEPISLVANFSHRGLTGGDLCDCGFLFIYLLSNIALRPTIARITGFQPQTSIFSENNKIAGL